MPPVPLELYGKTLTNYDVVSRYRTYFIALYVLMSTCMVEIITGVMIDSMAAVREEIVARGPGGHDALHHAIEHVLNDTQGPSGNIYGESWELKVVSNPEDLKVSR